MPLREPPPTATITEADLRAAWADEVRVQRLRRRLTQFDVADVTGMRANTVARAEDGRGSLGTFLSIARALDIDLWDIARSLEAESIEAIAS
jgi:transcriptional regulator with XRE-family HTH domain